MSHVREIKQRMKSITDTKQITKAMKLISASKLQRARRQLGQTLPYFTAIERTMADILSHSGAVDNVYFDRRTDKQDRSTGFFVFSGDQSLAGGYNHNIVKLTEETCLKTKGPILFVAGQVGRNYFCRKSGDYVVARDFDCQIQNPTVRRAGEIAEIMLEHFEKGRLDDIYLVYTNMVNTLKLEPKVIKLLPMSLDALREATGVREEDMREPDDIIYYEPSPNAVFVELVPKYLKGVIYGAMVESFASEQSARMTAMDSATTNADKMLQSLNLSYNRARQSSITQEITEIVGGASAL